MGFHEYWVDMANGYHGKKKFLVSFISTVRCSIHTPTRRYPSNHPIHPPTYSTTVLHTSLTCYCSKISNNIAKKSKFQNASSVGRTKRNMMHKIGWIACYSPCIIDFMQRLKAFLKPRGVFLCMINSTVRQEITKIGKLTLLL